MNTSILQTLHRVKTQKIGKLPVVVLPLDYFEKIKEDLEMYQSKKLRKEIVKARMEVKKGKFLTFEEAKKKLRLQLSKLAPDIQSRISSKKIFTNKQK